MPQLIASVEGVEIKHVFLEKDRTTLGRKPHNNIVLNHPVVSGEHCVFELRSLADVFIEDLGSTNGTYINGQMIKSRQKLRDRDVIAIGNFKIEYLASSTHEVPPPHHHEETRAMSVSTLQSLGEQGTSGVLHASLKLLTGSSAGLEMPVVKAVTTFGQPGVAVVSVSHRRNGYFVARLQGDGTATLNGKQISLVAVPLEHHDVLELAGTSMEFLLKNDEP